MKVEWLEGDIYCGRIGHFDGDGQMFPDTYNTP